MIEKKQMGNWKNDIKEIGYQYQMTDIGAALLLESIKDFKKISLHRKKIFEIYDEILSKNKKIKIINKHGNFSHGNWIYTIVLDKKDYLQKQLRLNNIETNQVHFRNDRYSIFKKFVKNNKYKNMDLIESKYLVLPVHMKMALSDAKKIANLINTIIK